MDTFSFLSASCSISRDHFFRMCHQWGFFRTWRSDRLSALFMSLMALQLMLEDGNPFQPLFFFPFFSCLWTFMNCRVA